MTAVRRFVERFTASVLGRRDDERLRDELAEHLALLTEEYERAGLKTLPGSRGESAARREIAAYLVVQVACSLVLFPLGVTGVWYLAVAALSGAAILVQGIAGATRGEGARWARNVFLASIVYLPVVFTAMVLDGRL